MVGLLSGHTIQALGVPTLSGTAEEVAEKRSLPKKQQPQGLKPELISRGLRGPEGPLFHGKAAHL